MFEQSKIVASIPAQWPFHPSYMHSFGKIYKRNVNTQFLFIYFSFIGITDNYFVIVEQPLTLSVPKLLLSTLTKRNTIASSLKWYPGEHVRLIFFPLHWQLDNE